MHNLAFGALLMFVFVLPWEDSVVFPGIGSVSRVAGLLLFVLSAPAFFSKEGIRLRNPSLFLVLMGLFVFWSAISYFWSINQAQTMTQIITMAQLLVMVFLFWQFCTTPQQLLRILQAYILGSYVSITTALLNFASGEEAVFRRFSALGFDPNDFATMLALGIPMAWYLLLTSKRGARFWLNAAFIPLALLVIILTSSRGGALVTLVALSVIPLTFGRLSFWRKLGFWGLLTASVYGLFAFSPGVVAFIETSLDRLSSASTELAQGTLSQRTEIWLAGLEVFESHALLGVGAGSFPAVVEPILGAAEVAHNSFISVLVETGIVGFTLFLALLLAVLVPLLRLPHPERTVSLVLFATLMIGMLPLSWEMRKPTWFVLTVLTLHLPLVLRLSHEDDRVRLSHAPQSPRALPS